jgi:hypothetical protein
MADIADAVSDCDLEDATVTDGANDLQDFLFDDDLKNLYSSSSCSIVVGVLVHGSCNKPLLKTTTTIYNNKQCVVTINFGHCLTAHNKVAVLCKIVVCIFL